MLVRLQLSLLYRMNLTRRADPKLWEESYQVKLIGCPRRITSVTAEMCGPDKFHLDHKEMKKLPVSLRGHSVVVIAAHQSEKRCYLLPHGLLIITPDFRLRMAVG